MDNGFQLKWRFGIHGNWKNQNPGGRFGVTKTALPIWPIRPNVEVNGLDWQCFLAGNSKTAPRILIFFNWHGCQTFILAENHCYLNALIIQSWNTKPTFLLYLDPQTGTLTLSGDKLWVTNGANVDIFIVWAKQISKYADHTFKAIQIKSFGPKKILIACIG